MRSTIGLRTVTAALPWIAALATVTLLIAAHAAPGPATAIARSVLSGLRGAGLAALGALGVGLVLWPPFLPWVRLRLRRLRDRLSVDQTPLYRALDRLEHLETPQDHLTAARKWLDLGHSARALPHLLRAVELDPEYLPARYVLGKTALDIGELRVALEHLAYVVEHDEQHAFGDALLALGRTLWRGGRPEEAARVLERHEQRFGPHRAADRMRARILRAGGDREAAHRLLVRAARPIEPGTPSSLEDRLERALARVDLIRGVTR